MGAKPSLPQSFSKKMTAPSSDGAAKKAQRQSECETAGTSETVSALRCAEGALFHSNGQFVNCPYVYIFPQSVGVAVLGDPWVCKRSIRELTLLPLSLVTAETA